MKKFSPYQILYFTKQSRTVPLRRDCNNPGEVSQQLDALKKMNIKKEKIAIYINSDAVNICNLINEVFNE